MTDKRQAIALLGQLLAAGGCTDERYGHSMAQREALADTFLGAGVAIPHGRVEDRHLVRRDGLAVLQIQAASNGTPANASGSWSASRPARMDISPSSNGSPA